MNQTIISLFIGAVIGWGITQYRAALARRLYLRETTQQMKQSGEIHDNFYAMMLMSMREALGKLESGDLEGAKGDLSGCIANLYHVKKEGRREFNLPPSEPDRIGQELRAVEEDAKRIGSLRSALARKKNEAAA